MAINTLTHLHAWNRCVCHEFKHGGFCEKARLVRACDIKVRSLARAAGLARECAQGCRLESAP